MENVIKFLKELFGDNFELKALSYKEGEILPINELDSEKLMLFFTMYLWQNTIWYNPFDKVLYSYKPQKDSFFKKAVTNAWAFKYIFYPYFIEDWGGWWSNYVFHIYEKGLSGNYKFQHTIN